MIDEATFKDEWAALCERFNRKPSVIETKRYYDYCNAHLDTAAFVSAAHLIYANFTFWPRPVDFVGEIDEWEQVVKLLRNFGSPLDSLSPAAQRAVRAMGGLSRIGASEDDLPFRRKEFRELCAEYHGSAPRELPTPEGAALVAGLTQIGGLT
jgi:hypothetical protein